MNKRIFKQTSALLAGFLAAVILFIGLPIKGAASGTQDREPSLEDSLLIHYDFKGDTLEEKLADKAGSVKTDLSVIGNEAVQLNADGTVANAITDEAAVTQKGVKFDESGTGSVTANQAAQFALTTGKTADTDAVHESHKQSNMTWYLRVKVSTSSAWLILLSMRDTATNNRVMHIEGSNNRIQANIGPAIPEGDVADGSNMLWNNQWHEIAIVRTISPTDPTKDHYALYTSRNYNNPNGEWYLAAEGEHTYTHGSMSSEALVMSLFANVQSGYEGIGQNVLTYDDVRVYNKALSVNEMKTVHGEVIGGVSLEDNLLIHYDFKGSTLQEKLADKAGAVNTNLNVIGNEVVQLNADGTVKNAITDETTATQKGVVFDESGTGSVTASKASGFALTTGITADTTAMHVSSTPTDMTWYLRVKVSASSGWLILLSMRTTSPNNRVMHIEGTGNRIKANIGSALPNGEVADGSNALWGNQWHEIALVRTAATTAAGKDHYALYTSRNYNNPNGEWYLAAEADHTYTHESMSAEELVMSLFANVQTGYEGIGQNLLTYDDVRVYSKALSVDEMKKVHGEVVGVNVDIATPMPITSEVEIYGAQRSLNNTEKNAYSIRLLAQIKEGCTAAGFYVTPGGYNQQKIGVSVAYTSILAGAENGTLQEIKAAEGHYLIAITISDIPVSVDEITFTVTPYIVKDETETTGRTVIFALKDALIQSATWVDPPPEMDLDIYPTLYQVYFNRTLTAAEQEDQLLCEALVRRMGNSMVVSPGKTVALWNGMIQKLDTHNYSAAATLSGTSDVIIPADLANRYFGDGTANGAVSLKSMAAQKGYTYYYDATNKLAIISPAGVPSFSSASYMQDGYSNQQYRNRMAGFFNNSAMPEPGNNTEQSRVVIEDAVDYFPYDAEHYEMPIYTNYYSPAILTVEENGSHVLYVSNERSLTQNGIELSTVTVIHKSIDGGQSWQEVAQIPKLRWASLMQVNGGIYCIGSKAGVGLFIFRLNANGSVTEAFLWQGESGVQETLIDNGILYVPLDYGVASVQISSDIMVASNWIKTNAVSTLVTKSWFQSVSGKTLTGIGDASCLEGNMLKGKDGKLYVLYRIESQPYGNYAVRLELSSDRTKLSLLSGTGSLLNFPTTVSRFAVKYDAASGYYISISNLWTVNSRDTCRARNVVGISVSKDLVNWKTVDTLLVDREMMNSVASCWAHAYQYVDWDFDGDDLVLVVREATGFTNTFHDGKYLTFYRVDSFRSLLPQA